MPSLGCRGSWPPKALLHQVLSSGCTANGAAYAVVQLIDPFSGSHLSLVTSERFGDLRLLSPLCGIEVNLAATDHGLEILPLARQGKEALHHLLDQLLSLHSRPEPLAEDGLSARCQLRRRLASIT